MVAGSDFRNGKHTQVGKVRHRVSTMAAVGAGASASTMLRCGLRTSPETKLIWIQPSYASMQAIRATPKPLNVTPPLAAADMGAALPPHKNAPVMITTSPSNFAEVNNF